MIKDPALAFLKNMVVSLYDIYLKKRYTIEHKDIHFGKKYGYDIIVNPDYPDNIWIYIKRYIHTVSVLYIIFL